MFMKGMPTLVEGLHLFQIFRLETHITFAHVHGRYRSVDWSGRVSVCMCHFQT